MICAICKQPIPAGESNCPSCGARATTVIRADSEPDRVDLGRRKRSPARNQAQDLSVLDQGSSRLRRASLVPQRYRSPGLAAIMSFFVPGLGQIYVGQVAKGALMLALIVLGFFTGGFSHLVLVVYASLEAYSLAKRLSRGEPVSSWGTLWDPTYPVQ